MNYFCFYMVIRVFFFVFQKFELVVVIWQLDGRVVFVYYSYIYVFSLLYYNF